jgi:hypothetical protein
MSIIYGGPLGLPVTRSRGFRATIRTIGDGARITPRDSE